VTLTNKEVQAKKAAASKRQSDFVARKKKAGYVTLSSVYVPKVIVSECREVLKKFVADWEKEQPNQF